MKYVCLDYDSCGWYFYLQKEDYSQALEKVIYCNECSSLAVLVPNHFNIAFNLKKNQLYILLQEKE